MSPKLGTIDELPKEYLDKLEEVGVAPLWPMMRNVLPHNLPNPVNLSSFKIATRSILKIPTFFSLNLAVPTGVSFLKIKK